MTDNAVRSALEAEKKFLSVDAERYLYEMRERAYYDHESAMYSTRQDGIEFGMEQERMQTAERLFGMGMSAEIVCEGTGLSSEKVEEIRKCLMRNS